MKVAKGQKGGKVARGEGWGLLEVRRHNERARWWEVWAGEGQSVWMQEVKVERVRRQVREFVRYLPLLEYHRAYHAHMLHCNLLGVLASVQEEPMGESTGQSACKVVWKG
jgi:hypothetical protein